MLDKKRQFKLKNHGFSSKMTFFLMKIQKISIFPKSPLFVEISNYLENPHSLWKYPFISKISIFHRNIYIFEISTFVEISIYLKNLHFLSEYPYFRKSPFLVKISIRSKISIFISKMQFSTKMAIFNENVYPFGRNTSSNVLSSRNHKYLNQSVCIIINS